MSTHLFLDVEGEWHEVPCTCGDLELIHDESTLVVIEVEPSPS